MRTVEIIGYKRANLGKTQSKKLRAEGNAPCVLYGGDAQVHFYSPMILFRDLINRPEPAFVKLNIEGDEYDAILQDSQYHPVSEVLLHVDFLLLRENKPIEMEIPVEFTGTSVGVQKGGKLVTKLRKLKVRALPKNMPENIQIDISDLDLGKSIKVKAITKQGDYIIINNENSPVVTIDIPRSLKQAANEEAADTKKKK